MSELNKMPVVKKMIAITIKSNAYCALSFFPHDHRSCSSSAVYPIGNILLKASKSFFNNFLPCSEEPIYSYCRHKRYSDFLLPPSAETVLSLPLQNQLIYKSVRLSSKEHLPAPTHHIAALAWKTASTIQPDFQTKHFRNKYHARTQVPKH